MISIDYDDKGARVKQVNAYRKWLAKEGIQTPKAGPRGAHTEEPEGMMSIRCMMSLFEPQKNHHSNIQNLSCCPHGAKL